MFTGSSGVVLKAPKATCRSYGIVALPELSVFNLKKFSVGVMFPELPCVVKWRDVAGMLQVEVEASPPHPLVFVRCCCRDVCHALPDCQL